MISSTVCFADGNELRFSSYYLIPGNDDVWDNAIGVETQIAFWNTPNLGFALSGGLSKWNVNDLIQVKGDYAYKLNGSAMIFPFGISTLYRPSIGESAEVTFEGGIRYVFVNSDIDVTLDDDLYIYKISLDIDDGLVGIIGANVDFPVSPIAKFGFGAGYQFDISKGDVSSNGLDLDIDNELKGIYLRFGLTVKL
jgi:hypothetical protein